MDKNTLVVVVVCKFKELFKIKAFIHECCTTVLAVSKK